MCKCQGRLKEEPGPWQRGVKVMRTSQGRPCWSWVVKDEQEFARLCVVGKARKVEVKGNNWDTGFTSGILRRKETSWLTW